MTAELAKQVERYFDAGYLVLINDSPYVDSPVQSIYEEDGVLVYDSETFNSRPLEEVDPSYMIIAKPLKDIEVGKQVDVVGDADEYEVKTIDGKDL